MGSRLLENVNLFDSLDVIYCVHLPEDVERHRIMNPIFEKVGIADRVNWMSAPRPFSQYQSTNYQFAGEYGVVLSQLKILTNGLSQNPVFGIGIFEDDIMFVDQALEYIDKSFKELPDDWDIFYLGGRPLSPLKKVSPHIAKIEKFTSAMSYCINANVLPEYIQFYIDRMGRPFPDACCDNILNDFILERNKNGYVSIPAVAWTIPGWSTLRLGQRDYRENIKKSWVEFGV